MDDDTKIKMKMNHQMPHGVGRNKNTFFCCKWPEKHFYWKRCYNIGTRNNKISHVA